MANSEPTNGEIMEFLQEHMVTKEEFGGLENRVSSIDTRVSSLDSRVSSLEVKINQAKLDILDGVDEKLAALKGDLTVMMRGEDRKLVALIRALNEEKSLSDEKTSMLLGMQPFPQT